MWSLEHLAKQNIAIRKRLMSKEANNFPTLSIQKIYEIEITTISISTRRQLLQSSQDIDYSVFHGYVPWLLKFVFPPS